MLLKYWRGRFYGSIMREKVQEQKPDSPFPTQWKCCKYLWKITVSANKNGQSAGCSILGRTERETERDRDRERNGKSEGEKMKKERDKVVHSVGWLVGVALEGVWMENWRWLPKAFFPIGLIPNIPQMWDPAFSGPLWGNWRMTLIWEEVPKAK